MTPQLESPEEEAIQEGRAVVRHPHLLGLREQGQDEPRAPHRVDGRPGQDLPGGHPHRGRDRDQGRPAAHRRSKGLPRLRAGRDDDSGDDDCLVRRAQHAGRDRLRRHGHAPVAAGGRRSQAHPAADERRRRRRSRSASSTARASRSSTARSPTSSAWSTTSTPKRARSACSSPSSAARRRSSWTSSRSSASYLGDWISETVGQRVVRDPGCGHRCAA